MIKPNRINIGRSDEYPTMRSQEEAERFVQTACEAHDSVPGFSAVFYFVAATPDGRFAPVVRLDRNQQWLASYFTDRGIRVY